MKDWDEKGLIQQLRNQLHRETRRRAYASRVYAGRAGKTAQAKAAQNRLAREAERLVAGICHEFGYTTDQTTKNAPFDLWVADDSGRAVRVEVKISLAGRNKKGCRYQANIRNHDHDLLVFIARNGQDWPFVFPHKALVQHDHIAIWSPCPADYGGQWAPYLNAWHNLHQAFLSAGPHPYQLPLFDQTLFDQTLFDQTLFDQTLFNPRRLTH